MIHSPAYGVFAFYLHNTIIKSDIAYFNENDKRENYVEAMK